MDLKINLKQFAPKNTYIRNGSKCYLDPFRHMLVPCTPESLLLYKMEMYVHTVMGVPKNMMYINQSFRKYGVDSSKIIDIVIHDMIETTMKPVAIIECKSPTLALYHSTTNHIEDFAKKTGVNYLVVTNGDDVDSYISREDRLSFWKIDNVPNYETICNGHKAILANQASLNLNTRPKPAPKPEQKPPKFNSKTTPKEIQSLVMSLGKCIRDDHSKMKQQNFDKLVIVGDCGQRRKLTGFGADKSQDTVQRTFLIKDYLNNHQLVSLDLTPDILGAPMLSVTLDDYDNRQVVVAFDLVQLLKVDANKLSFSIGYTELFSKEAPEFVQGFEKMLHERAPYLMQGEHLMFGDLNLIDPIKLDQEDTAQVFVNMICFALLLDEYRASLKSKKKKMK